MRRDATVCGEFVRIGPAFRRGALADDRMEQVGGVVVMRFGANPRDVIARIRKAVQRMNDPANGVLPDGVRIVPFYDRTQLIDETVKRVGSPIFVKGFVRFALGEGVEKKTNDFASEVAQLSGQT